MDVTPQISAMERDLAAAGITVKALCEEAEVNQSTWTRWKAGQNSPTLTTWSKVNDAFARLVKAAAETATPPAEAS